MNAARGPHEQVVVAGYGEDLAEVVGYAKPALDVPQAHREGVAIGDGLIDRLERRRLVCWWGGSPSRHRRLREMPHRTENRRGRRETQRRWKPD